MKRPLKAREVALVLLPALALGGFGWYQWWVETSGKRGLFVSSVQLLPETRGSYQATGTTHRLVVTVDYSWPRPRWWGKEAVGFVALSGLDTDVELARSTRGLDPNSLMAGDALTTSASPHKEVTVKGATRWGTNGTFSDGHYVFTSELFLAKVPAKEGAITFHGLYRIAGQKPIRVTRIVRKAGEVIQFKPNRNPNGRIVSIKADAFEDELFPPAKIAKDSCRVWFVASRVISSEQKVRVGVGDMKLSDSKGKRLTPYSTPAFTYGGSDIQSSDPNSDGPIINLYLSKTLKTTNPLILSGTLSIDEGWPIPFSVRLPPR